MSFLLKSSPKRSSNSNLKKESPKTKTSFLELLASDYHSEDLILPEVLLQDNTIKKSTMEYYHKLTMKWKKNFIMLKPDSIYIYSNQDVSNLICNGFRAMKEVKIQFLNFL